MTALVDQFGRRAFYHQSGASHYEDTQQKQLRQSRPMLDRDFSALLGRAKFKNLLSDCRYIYTAYDLVSGAAKQKSGYVSANGWMPRFLGEDRDWEAKALPVIKRALNRTTNKGWDITQLWKVGCRTIDRDGGFFPLRHKTSTGFPLTQVIEAHRVGTRDHSDRVQGGSFDGATIINGIIYSDDGREIGYNVLGSTREADRQISAQDMRHVADFDFFSENRPLPKIGYGVFGFYDSKETRGFQKIGQKARSAISLIESNEIGSNINAAPVPSRTGDGASQTADGMLIETYAEGMYRYIKNGDSIKTVDTNQPGQSWLDFDQTIVNGALLGMGWRAEMQDLSRLKGAGIRGFADNINQVIEETHEFITCHAYMDTMWKISCLIDRGDIPEHPEWDRWGFAAPRTFDPDPSKTATMQLDNVRAGRISMPHLIYTDGRDEDEVLISSAKYLKRKNEIAIEYGVDPSELGNLAIPGAQAATPPNDNQKTDTE